MGLRSSSLQTWTAMKIDCEPESTLKFTFRILTKFTPSGQPTEPGKKDLRLSSPSLNTTTIQTQHRQSQATLVVRASMASSAVCIPIQNLWRRLTEFKLRSLWQWRLGGCRRNATYCKVSNCSSKRSTELMQTLSTALRPILKQRSLCKTIFPSSRRRIEDYMTKSHGTRSLML